jgi:hypothetical protein
MKGLLPPVRSVLSEKELRNNAASLEHLIRYAKEGILTFTAIPSGIGILTKQFV